MKIGDKVRFLNDVGGGIISGFPDKETVLVCDEDGFEVPTLRKEVVVIDTDDYNIAKVHTMTPKADKNGVKPEHAPTSVKNALKVDDEDEEEEAEDAWMEREMTFRPMAKERRGANELNLMLAFVPTDIKHIADSAFEVYLVNDCNYYVHYVLASMEGNACTLRYEGELQPNTKFFLEEIHLDQHENWENLVLLTTAYKRDKEFTLKPALNTQVRIDFTKFYRIHTFQLSDFFQTPALLTDVVRNDHPVRSVRIDAEEIQESIQMPEPLRNPVSEARVGGAERRAREKAARNAVIEVDLHADALLDNLNGLQPKDILEYQLKTIRETLDEHLREHGRRIVFIHGKGDGVLRKTLLKEVRLHYKQCRTQDASFQEYGYGATMVIL